MTYPEPLTCELCHIKDYKVTPRLGWYREGGVAAIDRCQDAIACRVRVEEDGNEWPLLTRQEADRHFRRETA